MNFESLSDAIQYYSYNPNFVINLSPYSDVAVQANIVPPNINYVTPAPPNVLIYGQSVWGIGQIINVNLPTL